MRLIYWTGKGVLSQRKRGIKRWDWQVTFRSLSLSRNISLSSSLVSAVRTICMVAEEQRFCKEEQKNISNKWVTKLKWKNKKGELFTRSPNCEVEARPQTDAFGGSFTQFSPDITLFRISKMLEGSNKKPPHCPCSLFWVYVVTPADCVHG